MFYQLYELNHAFMAPFRATADAMNLVWKNPLNPWSHTVVGRSFSAGFEVFERVTRRYGKPAFGLPTTTVEGESVAVEEEIVWRRPFCDLIHFKRHLPAGAEKGPRILIVAPMSGHYATLLRGTVEALLPSADLYITDWIDARMVPVTEGDFDLDDYIDYLIAFLEHIGPGTHMLAVCQPSVPAYAAAAVMGANENPCRPATLTMMGGPIDTREAPTSVNDLAMQRPLEWFEHSVIATVPLSYPGAGRKVYPGFLQLAGFFSMNLGNHIMSHYAMFNHLVEGDGESADATKAFYDEYRSVCDMTAEFYLQTIEHVFQKHSLPRNEFVHRGQRIDLGAIRDTALLAIEGEKDDISGIGQTRASLHLAKNLPEAKKRYYLAENVGHYGIFNGSKWRGRIAPVVEEWIAQNSKPALKVVA